VQLLPVWLAIGAPSALNKIPAVAVVEFEITVLLTMLVRSASSSEMPAPSTPATFLAMMLLVTVTSIPQRRHEEGSRMTSVPFTSGTAIPPPVPDSAVLPRIRLALDYEAGAAAVAQARRTVEVRAVLPHSVPAGRPPASHRAERHHHQAAALVGTGRIGALVEDDRVVFDMPFQM